MKWQKIRKAKPKHCPGSGNGACAGAPPPGNAAQSSTTGAELCPSSPESPGVLSGEAGVENSACDVSHCYERKWISKAHTRTLYVSDYEARNMGTGVTIVGELTLGC